jgi:hypothetical protein
MRLSPSARVRWLKAFEGMSLAKGKNVVGVKMPFRKQLEELGADIAGTEDALAVYIKKDPRKKYQDGTNIPQAIAGIIWLSPMPAGMTVLDFNEDAEYPIGWPIAEIHQAQAPKLVDILKHVCPSTWPTVWKSMCGSLTGGKPFRIDQKLYAPLSDELTRLYCAP